MRAASHVVPGKTITTTHHIRELLPKRGIATQASVRVISILARSCDWAGLALPSALPIAKRP